MTNTWHNHLKQKLIQAYSAEQAANLFDKYQDVFSSSYLAECSPSQAVDDIKHLEKLSQDKPVSMAFYRTENQELHLRLFQFEQSLPLSIVLPMLENMDLHVDRESPYHLQGKISFWINDFIVAYPRKTPIEIDKVTDFFEEAFIHSLNGLIENDGLHKLILGAQLSGREIVILRCYAKYLRQTAFRFSQVYVEQTLTNYFAIAKQLINLFIAKFDPAQNDANTLEKLEFDLVAALDAVSNLEEDRILRRFLELIKATVRTNYFQTKIDGQFKSYLAIKLSSRQISDLPLPLPLYEIFIYSPQFEGIHLRNSKIARGGIRWSERREDFRTEILSLMKAQIVKNALIVPSGAKGGFVIKSQPDKEALQSVVLNCYDSFIRGLLDLTDNLVNEQIIKPPAVRCHDENDPYLVVAADKGTASFSDKANSIAKEYNFWLNDAFASGGSAGYDHKKMGITAKGAWESVKRHFSKLNLNVFENDFTVVGIGDMSGDVFGNGLIYSSRIKLIGAFDHRHIFLDPNPNPETTYQERLRLFKLPASSWKNFNPDLISKGGGVYSRSQKSIAISPEVQQVLAIIAEHLSPNELIQALLKAPVNLLWNGGVGAYVKARSETNSKVADKANEYCRVNGDELRCAVVGEGGNLGFTQSGRIEYALGGGLINTDFIDNSAGVDCSDHEVNIKILLNAEMQKKNISLQKRDELLASMTTEVAEIVLKDNYQQALTLSLASFYSNHFTNIHQLYLNELIAIGLINRAVEFLPNKKTLQERKAAKIGLTSPELAVLLTYTKIHLKHEILNSDIPDHSLIKEIIYQGFPDVLRQNYSSAIAQHRLKREIIATQLSNRIANQNDIAFLFNLQNETSAPTTEIIYAYIIACEIFQGPQLHGLIESFDNRISVSLQYKLLTQVRHLIYLAVRWFLLNKNLSANKIESLIQHYTESVKSLQPLILSLMDKPERNYLDSLTIEFSKSGISIAAAERMTMVRIIYPALDIIHIVDKYSLDLALTAQIYLTIDKHFHLHWLRDQIAQDSREGYWENLSRLKLQDELDILQKHLTAQIIKASPKSLKSEEIIQDWLKNHNVLFQRWQKILKMLQSSTHIDYVMLFTTARQLSDLFHENT